MHPFEFLQRYGPTAVVSDASSILGEAFACELAKGGFDLVLPTPAGISLETLAARLEDHEGIKVLQLEADPDAPRYAENLLAACGNRDIGLLVCCLGAEPAHMHEAEPGLTGSSLAGSSLTGSRPTGPHQIGSIVSSLTRVFTPVLGDRTGSGLILADERGIARGLGESLWRELHPLDIDVLTLCPDEAVPIETAPATPRQLARTAMEHIARGPVFNYPAQSWGEPG